ncbi:SNF2-related protein [Kitasatospora sp. NPDC088134]|uniref:SNF2-related protein n=1 Tax=Kitasatospora sp. NPDC088134 TaxID=3364071 RepID=UPI0037F9A52D
MPEKTFTTALLASVRTGRQDPVLVAEVVRRAGAGQVPVRDAEAVLLGTRDALWQPAREAVLRWLVDRPEAASAVLAAHTQLAKRQPPKAEEGPPSSSGFSVRMVLDLPTGQVVGPWGTGRARKSARHQAMLRLLAQLAELQLPTPTTPGPVPAPTEQAQPQAGTEEIPGGPLTATRWTALDRVQFSAALQGLLRAGTPEPDLLQEVEERGIGGRLSPKDWLAILLQDGPQWAEAKTLALRTAGEVPGLAATVVNQLVQLRGTPPVKYSETRSGPAHAPRFEIAAQLLADGGPVTGQPRRGGSRKDAQDKALRSLLAVLAGTADPQDRERLEDLPRPLRPVTGSDPLAILAAAAQAALVPAAVFDFEDLQGQTRCRARTLFDGSPVDGFGTADMRQDAKIAAAAHLVARLRAAHYGHEEAPSAPLPHPPAPVPAPRTETQPEPGGWHSGRDAVRWALKAGCCLLFRPSSPRQLLLHRPDGAPLHPDAPPEPLEDTSVDVVLLGPTGKPWRTTARAWSVPLDLALPSLAAPPSSVHPTVSGWTAVARLALQVVAAGAVIPAIDDAGHDVWRPAPSVELEAEVRRVAAALPPLAHAATAAAGPLRIHPALPAVACVVDGLIEALVRGPGTALLHGEGAFASVPARQPAPVQRWADELESDLDPQPEPELLLSVLPLGPAGPALRDGEPVVRARLTVRDETGAAASPHSRGARRVLRRAAAVWAPLARPAYSPDPAHIDLGPDEVSDLLGPAADLLEDTGVRLQWPQELVGALGSYTVLGAGSTTPDGLGLTMSAMLSWSWQFTLDGSDLTEDEMDALAEAARPLVRLRDRWLIVPPLLTTRARTRSLGQIATRDALTSALAGLILVDGTAVPCRPAGALATVVTALREGPDASPPVPVPAGLRATLRPYQQRGFEWMAHLRALHLQPLNCDDMGLGKTLVTLAFLLHRAPAVSGPALVLCPTSLMDVWEQQAAEFAPTLRVLRYHGPGRCLPPDLAAGTMVVTTYGTMVRDADELARVRWGQVVTDEAHAINSGTSQAAAAIRRLDAEDRIALTGTPIGNRAEEFWAIEDWLNPGLFGSRKAFRDLIGRHTAKEADGDAAGLLRRIARPFVLRRLKTDPQIAPDLPEKVQVLHPVALSTEQAALYEAVVREATEELRTAPRAARGRLVLSLLSDLRKIVNDPALFLGEAVQDIAADLPRARSRSAKLDKLLDLVDTARAKGEQVIVCVNFLPIGDLITACLTAAGHQAVFFQGSTPPKVRKRMVDDFQAGRTPVLVLSVRAGGEGLTLTAATEVIHYDSPWTDTAKAQATDRAFRIGQTRIVHARLLQAAGTVEERIGQVVTHKATLGQAALPSGANAFTDLDQDDLNALVTLGGLAR